MPRTALRLGVFTSLALAAARPLDAQGPRPVRGTVADSAGAPLPGAVVALVGAEPRVAVRAGPGGSFVAGVPDAGARLVAMRIGFAPETLVADADGSALGFRLRPAAVALEPIAVAADRAFTASGSELIRQLDIALRPRESSQELLRMVPGLVIAQHAGGGKAEQIFLRGFDADHGTDVAVSVDGTPVNMVSHAHGQGYADLHFLIPEVASEVEVRKGPYDVRDGDFATAGAVAIRTLERLDVARPVVEARGGSFGTARSLLLLPLGGDAEHAGGYVAAAGHVSDGPVELPQRYRRGNLFARWTAPLGRPVLQLHLLPDRLGERGRDRPAGRPSLRRPACRVSTRARRVRPPRHDGRRRGQPARPGGREPVPPKAARLPRLPGGRARGSGAPVRLGARGGDALGAGAAGGGPARRSVPRWRARPASRCGQHPAWRLRHALERTREPEGQPGCGRGSGHEVVRQRGGRLPFQRRAGRAARGGLGPGTAAGLGRRAGRPRAAASWTSRVAPIGSPWRRP